LRVCVLGIGNILFGDEGAGVHFARFLERNFAFRSDKHTIEFIDGGTLAMALTPILADFQHVVLIDCISADGAKPGEVYFFDIDSVPLGVNFSGSAHEIEMLQTLKMMEILGDRPAVRVLGIVPKRIEGCSFALSREVTDAVQIAQDAVLSHLRELGFEISRVADVKIGEVASEFARGRY